MRLLTKVVAVFAVALAGCSRPVSYEQFVRTGDKGADGQYHYSLDFSDSLCTYNLYFYSRIDCGASRLSSLRDFPLSVTFVSPSGQKYQEKVYFKVHSKSVDSDHYSSLYKLPYRSGLVPEQWGEWQMSVRIDSDGYIPGFRGLGVICEKNI